MQCNIESWENYGGRCFRAEISGGAWALSQHFYQFVQVLLADRVRVIYVKAVETYLERRQRGLKSVAVQVEPEDMQPLLPDKSPGEHGIGAIRCTVGVDASTQYEVEDQIAAVELTLENDEEIALEMVA